MMTARTRSTRRRGRRPPRPREDTSACGASMFGRSAVLVPSSALCPTTQEPRISRAFTKGDHLRPQLLEHGARGRIVGQVVQLVRITFDVVQLLGGTLKIRGDREPA